jgi:vancomycin resistance protein YoaR
VTSSVIKPEVTLSAANTLGIQEIIGVGTSDYSGSIPERVHNLLLASERLNGTLIPKNEIFSYNKTVGEISASTGYKPAYVILNGRTVLGDGGGVCQTSTTIFRAAINSGLPIIDWAPHAYRVHYYENDGKPGKDATVYAPSQDFSFRNNTPAAILIQTEADIENNLLKYTLWGKKDARKIYISDVSMGNSIPAPEPKEQEDPTLPRGQRRQVDWAANGLNAWFDYKVTLGNELIQEKRFVSNYRPWQAVYLVGTKD